MRSRSISIYSQEDYERQMLSYIKNEIAKSNSTSSNSDTSDSEDETNSEEEVNKMISALNQCYKINKNICNDELSSRSESIIAKCIKEIILNKKCMLFNRGKRIKSFDVNDINQRIKFRNLMSILRERKICDVYTKNIISLSYLNILIVSNFDSNLKLNFSHKNKINSFSYTKCNSFPLNIYTKQIAFNNNLLTIKIFDIDFSLELFSIYQSLSNVIILCLSGSHSSDSLKFLKIVNNNTSQLISVIEHNATSPEIKSYCEDHNYLYCTCDDLTSLNENLFMNYLLKIKYTMSLKDYIDEEDDDSDCLQQGTKYNLTMECRKDDMISLKRNHIVFSNKKMSVDSYNY